MILLDTDVVIDLLRGLPAARAWFWALGNEPIILPGYVAMELVQGCRTSSEMALLEESIRSMRIAWPSRASCDRALATYARGRFTEGLGLLDALVGELAISLGLPLYTFNEKHYSAIPELSTVKPYDR